MSDQSIWLERDKAFEAQKILDTFEKYFYVHIDYSEMTGDKGSTIYVYPSFNIPPICADCAGVAIQAGIEGIVGFAPEEDDTRAERWNKSISISNDMWKEANLFIRTYKES